MWLNPILNFLPDGSLNPDRKVLNSQSLVLRPGVNLEQRPALPARTPAPSSSSFRGTKDTGWWGWRRQRMMPHDNLVRVRGGQ